MDRKIVMFWWPCAWNKEVQLSGCNTNSVAGILNLFLFCVRIRFIQGGDWWTTNIYYNYLSFVLLFLCFNQKTDRPRKRLRSQKYVFYNMNIGEFFFIFSVIDWGADRRDLYLVRFILLNILLCSSANYLRISVEVFDCFLDHVPNQISSDICDCYANMILKKK